MFHNVSKANPKMLLLSRLRYNAPYSSEFSPLCAYRNMWKQASVTSQKGNGFENQSASTQQSLCISQSLPPNKELYLVVTSNCSLRPSYCRYLNMVNPVFVSHTFWQLWSVTDLCSETWNWSQIDSHFKTDSAGSEDDDRQRTNAGPHFPTDDKQAAGLLLAKRQVTPSGLNLSFR